MVLSNCSLTGVADYWARRFSLTAWQFGAGNPRDDPMCLSLPVHVQ